MSNIKKCPFESDIEVFFTLQANDFMAAKFAEHLNTCTTCPRLIQNHWTSRLPDWLQKVPVQETLSPKTTDFQTKSANAYRKIMLETLSRDIQADLEFLPPSDLENALGFLGGLDLIRVIGSGGMGIVFEALDSKTGERFALKTLKIVGRTQPNLKKRFFREAEIIKELNHEGIVPFIKVGEDQGIPYFIMHLLKGNNLENYVLKNNQISFPYIVSIIRSLTETLGFAHDKGILHRDIKPANIWIENTDDGLEKIRVLDFGLALADNKLATLTMSGQLLGTPAYMPPEQTDNTMELTRSSDLFSLGCVFYLLVTGKRVFPGSNLMEILRSQALFRIIPPSAFRPDTPPRLEQLILWLLQKSPAKRPQSARELLDKLDHPKLLKYPLLSRRNLIYCGIGASLGVASLALYNQTRPKPLPILSADRIYDTPKAIFVGECSKGNGNANSLFWVSSDGFIHYLNDSGGQSAPSIPLGFTPGLVSTSSDGRKLLVCGNAGELCVFSFISNIIEIVERINLESGPLSCCIWTPNQKIVSNQFIITTGTKIRIFNILYKNLKNEIIDAAETTAKTKITIAANYITPDVKSNVKQIQIHPLNPNRLLIAMESGDVAYANLNQNSMIFQSSFEIGPFSMTKRNDITLKKSLMSGPFVMRIRKDGVNACILSSDGELQIWQPEEFVYKLLSKNIGINDVPIEPIDIQYSYNSQSIVALFKTNNLNKIVLIDELTKKVFANIDVDEPIFVYQNKEYYLILSKNGKVHIFDKYKNANNIRILLR